VNTKSSRRSSVKGVRDVSPNITQAWGSPNLPLPLQ